MRRLRRHLTIVVFSWLLIQLSAVAAPVVLAASTAAAEDVCTCAVADHETCPMHHGLSDAAASCAMRTVHPPTDVSLLSLAGGTGVLPAVAVVTRLVCSSQVVVANGHPSSVSLVLDSPPPRS